MYNMSNRGPSVQIPPLNTRPQEDVYSFSLPPPIRGPYYGQTQGSQLAEGMTHSTAQGPKAYDDSASVMNGPHNQTTYYGLPSYTPGDNPDMRNPSVQMQGMGVGYSQVPNQRMAEIQLPGQIRPPFGDDENTGKFSGYTPQPTDAWGNARVHP